MTQLPTPVDVLSFWFDELSEKQHFIKDETLDREIRERFLALHTALSNDLGDFGSTPQGQLAALLVFDQFSRNMSRGKAEAFLSDGRALKIAKALVAKGDDLSFSKKQRMFLYMPFMHAENLNDQLEGVRLFELLGDEKNTEYARRHLEVIQRFGRFPHRNQALGRISTPEEVEFINTPGTGF